MNSAGFLIVAICSLVVAHLAATAAKVLRDMAWHELEDYARRKGRQRFDLIHDFADEVAIGTETLLYLAISIHAVSGFAWLATTQLLRFALPVDFVVTISISTFVLLATVVWLPTAIAESAGTVFIYHTWPAWQFLSNVLSPLAMGASASRFLVRRMLAITEDEDEEEALEEEIRTIVAEGELDGLLDSDTRDMIEGVIELDDANVADIMTPRDKMDVMSVHLVWEEMLHYVSKVGRTRIPVFNGSQDEFLGVLYVKDLFAEAGQPEHDRRPLREIIRPTWNVPATMHLDELLQQFRQTRNHLALVSDEYNAVIGLVTIEDVLEEIVGEIVDESDKEDIGEINVVSDREAVVVGRAHLQEINEQLGYDFPEDDEFDTMSGFLVHQLGRIPRAGEIVVWNDLQLRVLEASGRRAERIRISSACRTDV